MRWFLAVVVGLMGCASLPRGTPSAETTPVRWEQRCEVGHDLGSTNNILRDYGEEGWELVAVAGDTGAILCFKRRRR